MNWYAIARAAVRVARRRHRSRLTHLTRSRWLLPTLGVAGLATICAITIVGFVKGGFGGALVSTPVWWRFRVSVRVASVVVLGYWGRCLRRSLTYDVLNPVGVGADNHVRVRYGRSGTRGLLSARFPPGRDCVVSPRGAGSGRDAPSV